MKIRVVSQQWFRENTWGLGPLPVYRCPDSVFWRENNFISIRHSAETDPNCAIPADGENILKLLRERPVQAVIFEDYDKGAICPELIEAVTKQAESLQIPICVDPKKRNFNAYRNVSLFKPNLTELSEGLQVPKSGLKELSALRQHVRDFMERQGHRMVMTTLSENGLLLCYFNQNGDFSSIWIPAIVRNISDVSGAGDTVISIAALGMITGLPAEQMAEMANIAGGLVCETVGVVPVNKALLEKECERLLF